jgi:hypothetical protein
MKRIQQFSVIAGGAIEVFRTLFPHLAFMGAAIGFTLLKMKNPYNLVAIRVLSFVPGTGIEPVRPCGHRILSPACLPVPPPRHGNHQN